jgi:type IV pilus assembly protein PilA
MPKRNRRGFTLMELMIVIAVILVILTVAIPNLAAARIHANETMVQKMIGTIHTAQMQYQSQTGNFAVSLDQLNKLIPPKLAAGRHTGYRFIVQGTPEGYQIVATPEKPGSTGTRTFTSDQTGVVQ